MIDFKAVNAVAAAVFLIALTGCMSGGAEQAATDPKAPEIPGLKIGDRAPDVSFTDGAGEQVSLSSLYESQPVVVTFYRGGWCPFCMEALADWQEKLPALQDAGANFVAVTMEKPQYADETVGKLGLDYLVLLDGPGHAAEGFRIKFNLDDATRTKYQQYGIDLEDRNSSGNWTLPAPGTFLIDTDGIIRYSFADWDYKNRADPDEVIAAARALTK